jgi:enterochelin esterase family protein
MSPRTLFLALMFAVPAWPQADNLVSPEIQPDRRVTFRVRAPKATEVSLSMDYMPAGTREKMTRDGDGVWSVTIGPLDPTVYIYSFNVDGVAMADPVNPNIKLRARTSASMVDVPAEAPGIWEARDVPHGGGDQLAEIDGDQRRDALVLVHAAGLREEASQRYPVLYLFHGSNDTAGGWTLAGHANFILTTCWRRRRRSR